MATYKVNGVKKAIKIRANTMEAFRKVPVINPTPAMNSRKGTMKEAGKVIKCNQFKFIARR
jgi:hypothetical protein